jgi:CBS domain containing-hemolysin-like protein
MTVVVGVLFVVGSLLAMAEASMSRMTLARALALRQEDRRNAQRLVRIQEDASRFLNSIYLAVMLVQNGSAILVALIAERAFGDLGITLISVGFTLLYFVCVEAMSKTFGILRSDQVALTLAPIVWALARIFSVPVRGLIGLANLILPGKGLKQGPFVSAEEIRSMADVGHEEGVIEAEEKELIHSIFEFGDTLVRQAMTPRPDMIVVKAEEPMRSAMEIAIRHGFSRIPVYENEPDNIVGVVYAKDLFKTLAGHGDAPRVARDGMRAAYFVAETMKVSDVLREMQRRRVHMAIVADEHGDVAGLVTLEDILEEIVGEISDEYDVEELRIAPVGSDAWRIQAKMPISEFNKLVDTALPEDEDWQTIGGLVASTLARIPQDGDEVDYNGFVFRVERVQRRRIGTVLVRRSGSGLADDGAA